MEWLLLKQTLMLQTLRVSHNVKNKLYFFCYFFNINENNQINLGRVFAMSRDYSNMETDQVIKEEIVRH